MKKITLAVYAAFQLFAVLFVFSLPQNAFAQQKALIDANFILTLDEAFPLATTYEVDVDLSLFDKDELQAFARTICDPSFRMTPNLEESKLLIEIIKPEPAGTPMTVTAWNEHLAVKSRRVKSALKL